jgi:mRNA interferase MazF
MTVRRGEIYWVEFVPVKGSEQGGVRPALVVQNDVGNRFSPTTVVAAITTRLPRRPFPFVVVVDPAESGLAQSSAINCSQLATVQQSGPHSRFRAPRGANDVQPIATLGAETMERVSDALRYSLTLG